MREPTIGKLAGTGAPKHVAPLGTFLNTLAGAFVSSFRLPRSFTLTLAGFLRDGF